MFPEKTIKLSAYRLYFFLVAGFFLFLVACTNPAGTQTENNRPRLLVTTDIGGDPDDTQSLVRLLVYSNEFDLEGWIASASGTPDELGKDTVQPGIILDCISAYEKVYPFLTQHSTHYPDPGQLVKVVKTGNPQRGIRHTGQGFDSEGSEYIIELADRDDGRKLNISIWGGQTDLYQALWKVKNSRSEEEFQHFISKLRIYDTNDQDSLYAHFRSQFPGLFYILSKAPEGADKREGAYRGMYLGGDESLTSREWLNENLLEGHGELGKKYPAKTWTDPNPYGAMKEGDTPSWFYFLRNGLGDPDNPEWGCWGGRFEKVSAAYYRDAIDFGGSETVARATVFRWRALFQNDFKARLDWCVLPFDSANHAPVAVINGDAGLEPVYVDVKCGEMVTMDAGKSFDPDGDPLDFYWWTYPEAGSNSVCPELENYLESAVTFLVPSGEEGRDIHMICEVSDRGDPVLTAFRRIVYRIH